MPLEYHQQWIGYLNPTGLVFSPNALDDAQAVINEGVVSEQKEFLSLVTKTVNENTEFIGFENVRDLFLKVLNWRDTDLNNDSGLIIQYSFSHPQFGEVVSPSYISKVNEDKIILIQELKLEDFDETAKSEDAWNSSPHFKFERLLREKQVSTGIIVSKSKLRIIFAPRGESSGYIDFPFKVMYQPSGRLVFAAFRELLSDAKVFNSPKGQSLIEILELSRKYQAQVSIELSGQVLAALYELLRGFQTANDDENGKLLEKTLKVNPQLIYEGLLTTLLRMVFIMYAEDRNLLATDEVYQSSYSLAGLYERLRQDEAQNPDTMDSRYGAWAQLISLFRLIYDGAEYDSEKGKVVLPARHGHLFDPGIYLFLEGRDSKAQPYNKAPRISDGVVFRVLRNLLVLNGERISYRTLDVEQIGSVYETMMGFQLGRAEGETIALRPAKSHGAPLPINLDEILATKDKAKKLDDVSGFKLTDKLKKEFNECKTIEGLESVLDKRIDRRATPFRLSVGAMVLVPSEARRKSGSHYTPRELTEPVVRVALAPILKNLGDKPTPEQILDLKICDPAMGSGAFLVETCRQLSEKLIESWSAHKVKVSISSDEDELLHARKLIAKKCLYGVDKNHMATNLAKLSLWLVTLAKDHSFSFLDHNLKHGDSLLGLSNKQIMAFDYTDRTEGLPLFQYMKDQLNEALEARDEIRNASEENNYDALKIAEDEYQERLKPLRLVGNLAIKCFFDSENEKNRIANLQKHSLIISNYFSSNALEKLESYCKVQLSKDFKQTPFHWELEFPEVFSRDNKGFDCFVGNPPFLGGSKISGANSRRYLDWLLQASSGTTGNCDLVCHFFRLAFSILNSKGTIGFITTNSISAGESRDSSLGYIIENGGSIFHVMKNKTWPGIATVVISILHISKEIIKHKFLDGIRVDYISKFLLNSEIETTPKKLVQNQGIVFKGHSPSGKGFIVDVPFYNKVKDENKDEVIRPYFTGDEVNNSLSLEIKRYAIFFRDFSKEEAVKWPELLAHLENTVRIQRAENSDQRLRSNWWLFERFRSDLYQKSLQNNLVLVQSRHSTYLIFTPMPSQYVFSDATNVFATKNLIPLTLFLHSTIHAIWAAFMSSSLGEGMRYTTQSCFETFPFPQLNESKQATSIFQKLMAKRDEIKKELQLGCTDLYHLFHDKNCDLEKIKNLREVQESLDQFVFNEFSWSDLTPEYEFIDVAGDDPDAEPVTFRAFSQLLENEIIKRLMQLNEGKFENEVRVGLHRS